MSRRVFVLRRSGFAPASFKLIPPLRRGHVVFDDSVSMTGDAPKTFLRRYEYGVARKRTVSKWPAYIAKVGDKWYPCESITEHLLTRMGQILGIRVADSTLARIDGQIRFLSRYFLGKGQQLVHGAEMFARHLDDAGFVEEAELERIDRELLTFQYVHEAVRDSFPKHCHDELLHDFVRMLTFDAIIGNHDRHHYNWGIVRHVGARHDPYFAPIFDTARGLFWNWTDDRIERLSRDSQRREAELQRYVARSAPKIGWDGASELSHVELIHRVWNAYPEYRENIAALLKGRSLDRAHDVLEHEFGFLMTRARRWLIMECLRRRLRLLASVIV